MKIENQNIEYKSIWKDDYLKWVCGFANAKGGYLYIGVDNSGNVIGIKNYQKLMEDLPNKISNILGILVEVNLLSENDNFYLEIKIEPYSNPISYQGRFLFQKWKYNSRIKRKCSRKIIIEKNW